MSKMIGYDTFGPPYPPEWDEPDMVICSICQDEVTEDSIILYDDREICQNCYEELDHEDIR